MVVFLVLVFITGLSVLVVLETIDAINKARGKPTNYARFFGYIEEGFQALCATGIVVFSFAFVICLGIFLILLIKEAFFG